MTELDSYICKAKNGDTSALSILVTKFNPLIYKTSKRVYRLYHKYIPIDEIITNARHLFMYLVCVDYIIGGRASFLFYIKIKLYGHLVGIFRPIATYRSRCVEINDNIASEEDIINQIYMTEIQNIATELYKFIDDTFDVRERDIIYKFICGNTPRLQLAKQYGISAQRMKYLHLHCISKLKQFLNKMGITKEDV